MLRAFRDPDASTSSGSAIVAGAALAVSGIYTAKHATAVAPRDLRQLLNSALNTQSNSPASDLIGVMPNLANIIARGI